MTTKRNTKASIRKKLLDQERKRLEEKAEHFAEIAANVEEIDALTLKTIDSLNALQKLDVSVAEVAETIGVPSGRLGALRRHANSLVHTDGKDAGGDDTGQESGNDDAERPSRDSDGESAGNNTADVNA